MGKNYYYMNLVRAGSDEVNPRMADCIFDSDSDEFTSTGFFSSDKLVRNFSGSYCRDILCSVLNTSFSEVMKEIKGRRGLAGIRCFGSVHNAVARYLLEDANVRTAAIEGFFRQNFKVNLYVRPDVSEEKEKSTRFPYRTNFSYRIPDKLETVDLRGYVTIYMKSWENNHKILKTSFVSWMLELFREIQIIRKICEGEITDIRGLVLEYVQIAVNRMKKLDNEYLPYTIVDSSEIYSHEQVLQNIHDFLADNYNEEGSDKLSMLLTAMYLVKDGFGLTNDERGSGPVSQVTYLTKSQGEILATRFLEYLGDIPLVDDVLQIVPCKYITSDKALGGICNIFLKVLNEKSTPIS